MKKNRFAGVAAIAGVVLLFATACSSGAAAPAASSAATAAVKVDIGNGTVTVSNPKPNIAFFIAGSKIYTWSQSEEEGAKAAAAAAGVTLDIYEANFDSATQFNQVQTAMSSGKYGAIALQPVDASLCKPLAEDALKYNILVSIFAATLCGANDKSGEGLWVPGTVSYIGGQNAVDGYITYLNSVAKQSPGPQKVLRVDGPDGYGSTMAFGAAFAAVSAQHPEFQLVTTVHTDYSTPDAYAKVGPALQGNPGITMIVTPYVDITVGAVKAMKGFGLNLPIYDIGGSTVSVSMLKAGTISGTWPLYPHSQGEASVNVLLQAASGKKVPRYIGGDGYADAGSAIITADGLSSFTAQW